MKKIFYCLFNSQLRVAVGLFLLLIPGLLMAQRSVTGTVTDPGDDSTIPGVAVLLKGTTTGVVTDIDGNFQITVPDVGGSWYSVSLVSRRKK